MPSRQLRVGTIHLKATTGTPATLDRWRRSFALVCPFLRSCASRWRPCLSVIGLKLLALAIIPVVRDGTAPHQDLCELGAHRVILLPATIRSLSDQSGHRVAGRIGWLRRDLPSPQERHDRSYPFGGSRVPSSRFQRLSRARRRFALSRSKCHCRASTTNC